MRNIFIFILCFALSFGLEFPYRNNSLYSIDTGERMKNVTIPCSDTDEVEWVIDSTRQANYTIQVDAPNKKNLIIKNPNLWDTGAYTCMSKKNPNVFMKIIVRVLM